jgi:hypothetical protein
MKRDIELIRHLLAYVEQQPAGAYISQVSVPDEFDGPTVGEHIALLIDRGLVEGEVYQVKGPSFMIMRLTWEGHDFLQSVQNETVWRKVLEKGKELGGTLTLEIAKELGSKYLKELAGL